MECGVIFQLNKLFFLQLTFWMRHLFLLFILPCFFKCNEETTSLEGHSHRHATIHPIFELHMHDINVTYHICFRSNHQHRCHIHFPGTPQSTDHICLLGNGPYSDIWQMSVSVHMSLRLNRTLVHGRIGLT